MNDPRHRTIINIRISDLVPGDVIDAANYKYRSTPCWREVHNVIPSDQGAGLFLVVLKGSDGKNYCYDQGIAHRSFDLVTVQK